LVAYFGFRPSFGFFDYFLVGGGGGGGGFNPSENKYNT
jgi:hypothetical protein